VNFWGGSEIDHPALFVCFFYKAVFWKIMANYLFWKLLQFFSSFLLINQNWNNSYSCNLTLTLLILTAEVQLALDIRIIVYLRWKYPPENGETFRCGSTSFSAWIHFDVLLKKVTSEHRKSNHANPCEVMVPRDRPIVPENKLFVVTRV